MGDGVAMGVMEAAGVREAVENRKTMGVTEAVGVREALGNRKTMAVTEAMGDGAAVEVVALRRS